MKPGLAAFAATAVAVALCACARHGFDASAEGARLMKRDQEWAEASAAGQDLERIVSYWSEDARVVEPGQPVYRGKAAIREMVAASLKTPGFKIHWVSEPPVFSPDGRMAYMPGVTELTVPGADGTPQTMHLNGLSVWRREPDGEWRCVLDMASEAVATGSN